MSTGQRKAIVVGNSKPDTTISTLKFESITAGIAKDSWVPNETKTTKIDKMSVIFKSFCYLVLTKSPMPNVLLGMKLLKDDQRLTSSYFLTTELQNC